MNMFEAIIETIIEMIVDGIIDKVENVQIEKVKND